MHKNLHRCQQLQSKMGLKFLISKSHQNKVINRHILNMTFFELNIVKVAINRQIWQLCPSGNLEMPPKVSLLLVHSDGLLTYLIFNLIYPQKLHFGSMTTLIKYDYRVVEQLASDKRQYPTEKFRKSSQYSIGLRELRPRFKPNVSNKIKYEENSPSTTYSSQFFGKNFKNK